MAVIITKGEGLLFPLTSPPPKPEPLPDPLLVAKVMDYGDREIVVTIPFPDSIELVAGVTNEILSVPDQSGKSVKLSYQELDQGIQKYLIEIAMGLPPFVTGKVNPNNPTKGTFFISYDESQPLNKARLTVWRDKGQDYGNWSVRLEFSPSKCGPNGLAKLSEGLELLLPYINLPSLIGAFRIARIDSAIDLIGATPIDLIAHIPNPGKRMVYLSNQGSPESVYFYQKKKFLKTPPQYLSVNTVGPHRLTLYERRVYHLQLSLKPPYGPCPVTRAEVSMRWTKVRPPLADLATMQNLFKGRRVAYASAVAAGDKRKWKRFCLAAFGGGVSASSGSWFPGPGLKFRKAYQDCAGDLIDYGSWDHWKEGLKFTGLQQWVDLAALA